MDYHGDQKVTSRTSRTTGLVKRMKKVATHLFRNTMKATRGRFRSQLKAFVDADGGYLE